MSRGPKWTDNERAICTHLWNNRDKNLLDTEVDTEISRVLMTRTAQEVRFFRVRNHLIRERKKPKIELSKPAFLFEQSSNKKEDSLPDIGVQVAKLIEKQTLMETTLWSINKKIGDLIELQKLANSMRRDELDLWRSIDARGKSTAQTRVG